MLRHKLYIFGKEDINVPCHMHYGKEIFDKIVEYGDYPALINADTGETVTYNQLAQQTVDIALSLTRIGVGKGDVVSICSEKRMEVMSTVLGIFCAGATYALSDISFESESLLHRVKIAKPKIMFISPTAYNQYKTLLDSVGCIKKYIIYGSETKDGGVRFKDFLTETADVKEFLPTPVDGWRDVLLILFSSGTTGLSKGVPWTHLGFLTNSFLSPFSVTNSNDNSQASIFISREWYFTYGLYFLLSCIRNRTTVVFSLRNEEKDYMQAIDKYKIDILQSTPSSIIELIKSDILDQYDLTSLKVIITSSTPILADQITAVKRRLPNVEGVFQLYGTTEAGNICSELHAPFGPRAGSVGTASNATVLKVVDVDTRQPLGPNQRGEICFKSPSLFLEYLGVDNSKVNFDEEGFFKSGDVGYYDEDNYFYVINRIKELIKYKDYSIAPAEIESLLLRHPGVRDAGVTSAPRADCGEFPVACVVPQPGCDVREDELMEIIATFRMNLPSEVRFVEKLPRGAGNKLDRRALKLML